MKKILSFLLLFALIFTNFLTFNVNITNAAGLDATRKLIDKTNSNNFKILRGTPFKFSFYNKLYNYYRLTDDGALVFGISPDNNNLSEGNYVEDKNRAKIKIKAGDSTLVKFLIDKTKIILPAGINYININGQYKVSDGTSEINIKKGNEIELANGDELLTNSGLYGIDVEDLSAVEEMKDNVKYDDAGTSSYVMISPGFINLDLSDPDLIKGYGIYEKEFFDSKGNLYATGYMWYGVVEGTDKEVKYGIVLYNTSYYNNIRLFYGDIDTSITTPVFAGISNGNASDKLDTAYSRLSLGSLNRKDDILIDGSKVYQELQFQLGYDPDPLDVNQNLILDYQERDTVNPYPFLDKPHSRFAIKFKVKINTDKTVCQRERVTSDGGDTLRWGKKDSNRTDFDDIDTFCFVAETPGIVILDNASYAKGGYKTGQSKCVVNHLSLMGFNSQTIGWNNNTNNNCWLTYKIKETEKDLTLEKDSPYKVLTTFLDDIDLRPVDFAKTMNQNSVVFGNPKPLIVQTATGDKEMNIVDPNFKPVELDMITSDTAYLIGFNGTDTYLLYTANRGDSWKIIHKMDGKELSFFTAIDNVLLIFFTDGTYIRNIENGVTGEWKEKTLEKGHGEKLNEMGLISNRRLFLVGNNGKLWKTYSAGDDFELIDAKKDYSLQNGEHLNSIDVYGANDVWISTNKGNILYSPNGGDSWYKKTTGSTIEYVLNNFEDGIQVFENGLKISSVGNYLRDIDPTDNHSLKFGNDYQYLDGCVNWDKDEIVNNSDYTNLEPFTHEEHDKYWMKGDLYIDYYLDSKTNIKGLKTLTLKDTYGHEFKINVSKILSDNGQTQKYGWNTLKVEIRDYLSDYYEFVSAPDDTTATEEHWQKINKYTFETTEPLNADERIGIGKISFAPSTNLSNITVVNKFDSTLTNTSSRTCKIDNDTTMSSLIDGHLDLNSFVDTDGSIKGFLAIDLYIENKNKWDIDKIELGNDDSKKVVWNDIKKFSSLGVDNITNGWNSFILPFNEDNSSNVNYVNKDDINWSNLTLFRVKADNGTTSDYNRYALDNIKYSSVANTNIRFIRFFNQKEGVGFDDSNSYITNNNSSWGMNGTFSRGPSSNMKFKKIIKMKGREVYGIGNDSQGWFSYYSLDKGKNSKLKFSDSGIDLVSFDMVDVDDGLAISTNGNIYELKLEAD